MIYICVNCRKFWFDYNFQLHNIFITELQNYRTTDTFTYYRIAELHIHLHITELQNYRYIYILQNYRITELQIHLHITDFLTTAYLKSCHITEWPNYLQTASMVHILVILFIYSNLPVKKFHVIKLTDQ